MSSNKSIYFLFCIIAMVFTSCKKTDKIIEQAPVQTETEQTNINNNNQEAFQLSKNKYSFSTKTISTKAFHTDAHKQYLADPMKFSEIPDQGISSGKTAVVGSTVAMLYPKTAFTFTDANNATINDPTMKGIPVPLSSLVEITGEKLKNSATDLSDYVQQMFEFQKNWNWFYPVKWQGHEGYIFGADLVGLNNELQQNQITAELYRTGGKYTDFYPITGFTPLSAELSSTLEHNKLAFEKTNAMEYPYPDDMIRQYQDINDSVTQFVTTDLAAHAQHLIFDRMLQFTEQQYFEPRLLELTNLFIDALSKNIDVPEELRNQAIAYFQVPQALLELAPEQEISDDWEKTVTYKEKDAATILSKYPSDVQADIRQVLSVDGCTSIVFNTDEDFSQYKPRGHYTKNGILEAYFRAEMWYGRIHFLIAKTATMEDTYRMEPIALLIIDTVKKNKDLYNKWAALFDPITSLIGMSDDLSFNDILPLWKDKNVSDFSTWVSNKKNLCDFMNLCHERLRPPAISSNALINGANPAYEGDSDERKPPMGWRFLGQRFTYDSYIHTQVSPPRLKSRDIVRGLDIMKAFGSQSADILLAQSDYPSMPGLQERLDALEKEFAAYDATFWNKTYYNQVLYQIKSQATFEQGSGFYFTESPAWNVKAQLSAHGTWAELRHDTILYVKQTYAERAGDGDFEPTYRTLPLPKPTHYIEPNVPFWEGSLASIENLLAIYSNYNLLDTESENVLQNMESIYQRALAIVKLEAANANVSQDDIDWIPTISAKLGNLILVHNRGGDAYSTNADQFKMACIADVFTNTDMGVVLETAVGIPYRICVPLNDKQGGKRIAIGYTFSYYEFLHQQNDRMTDEQWKAIVYKDQSMDDYLPFWEKPINKLPNDVLSE